ncbi:chemotaxis protein [Natronococcus pandeyae]|uniref:Chemotaxis protein n=1 Tax=Natronococcus pandeyae TaxID=2055836 RepID=A0A8J8Q5J6_9EURY|nr:methyl-accepting chemotaxis protein [Natronococcus pandeyae]TYL39364.1 chemotaxis protein [Natronococcus pandeyae]
MAGNLRRIVPAVIRRSYALKFGIVLLVLGLSVGTLGIAATATLTESVEETVLEEQENAAIQEARAIENWDEQNEQLLMSATNAPAMGTDDEEEIESYLQHSYSDLPEERMNALYVDTTTGEILAGADTDAETVSELEFPDEAALEDDLSEHTVQRTDPYAMPDELGVAFDDRPVVSYYIGVEEDRALVFTFNLADRSGEMLSSRYHMSQTDSGTTVTILNEDGEIISDDAYLGYEDDRESVTFLTEYEDDDGLHERALTDGPGATRIDEAPSETLHEAPYDFSPDGYVVGYHTTEDGWTVLVHTTDAEALGFVDTIDQYGTMITLGGVLLIGLFGAVLGRNTATSIDRLRRKAGQMEDGDLDVEFETKRIDNIGRLYDGFGSMRDELKRQITESEDARAEAERERERVERLNDDLEQAATAYGSVMETAADGDLTARMAPEEFDNETMQTIGTEFNEMLTEIEATVETLTEFATEVAIASEEVTASSEEVRAASEEVSESVQEISDGADRQHQSLQSVDTEMTNLSTTTEQIAASSNDVADIAERTARTSRDGRQAATEAVEACDDLEAERRATIAEFERLQEQVDQITDLTEAITEIAEQTNMLALNANIEASRSQRDDAEGFSAVAAEVKELSQDVKDAADRIDDNLEGIQNQTDRSAAELERTSEEIERVNDLVTNAVAALDEIAEYAQETNDGVQEISAASEEQAASTQEVVAMVDEVATISEETTAESETVAAAAEEQTTALTEVTRSADDLTGQATLLSEALDRFETDADATAGVDADGLAPQLDEGGATGASNPEEVAFEFDEEASTAPDENDREPSDIEREETEAEREETEAEREETEAEREETEAEDDDSFTIVD